MGQQTVTRWTIWGALAVYAVLGFVWTASPPGEGPADGAGPLAEMLTGFTLEGTEATARLSPLFAILGWVPYALTRSLGLSAFLVNAVSLAALIWAACLILRRAGVSSGLLVLTAAHLVMLGAFTRITLFTPVRPELCGLAFLTLAVALAGEGRRWPGAAAGVAAALAHPVGLAAPLYGAVLDWRRRVAIGLAEAAAAPAVLVWGAVQWWGRGGVPGMIEDFNPVALLRPLGTWQDPVFVAFAGFAAVTALGGLSVLLLLRRGAWATLRTEPEVLVLGLALLAYGAVRVPEAPMAFAFLAPAWLLLAGRWLASDEAVGDGVGLLLAALLTLVAHNVLASIDVMRYYVDWHPYQVYRDVAPSDPSQLWDVWPSRFLAVVVIGWLMISARGIPPVERVLARGWQAIGTGAAAVSRWSKRVDAQFTAVWWRPGRLVLAGAMIALVVVGAFLFRFNTLGGTLGGFASIDALEWPDGVVWQFSRVPHAVVFVVVCFVAAAAWRSPRWRARLFRGVPDLSPAGLAVYRVALARYCQVAGECLAWGPICCRESSSRPQQLGGWTRRFRSS